MTIKLTLHVEDLRSAVEFAVKMCSTKPSSPILQGVLVDAGDRLTLSGFDGDIAGRATVSANVIEPGRALIPGRPLAEVVKTAGKSEIVDIVVDEKVTIGAGRNRWSLPTMNVADYPQLPQPGDSPRGRVDGTALRQALARALVAAERPGRGFEAFFKESVSVIGEPETLAICGTDRFRLAVSRLPWERLGDLDVIVPVSVLKAATAAFAPEGSTVTLSTHRGLLTLASDSHVLTGRLAAGAWPLDWRAKLAGLPAPTARATFVVDDLRAAIERVLPVCDEKRPGALLTISEEDGFELSGWAGDRDGVAYAVAADFTGQPRRFGINPWFVRDALNTLGAEHGVMRLGGTASAPLDIAPLDADAQVDESYRHIIMPISQAKLRRSAP